MFSDFFGKKSYRRLRTLELSRTQGLFSAIIQSYREMVGQDPREVEEKRRQLFLLKKAVKSIFDEITTIKKSCAQGLTRYLIDSLAALHGNAIHLLLLEDRIFIEIAEMNSLSILSYLGKDYSSPWLTRHRIGTRTVYFFNSSYEIPEYVLSCNCLSRYPAGVSFIYYKRFVVCARIALEVFIASSISIQWLEKKKNIRMDLLMRILENGKEFGYILDRYMSEEDFMDFEFAREERIFSALNNTNDRVMIPYDQPFKVDDSIELDYRLKPSAKQNPELLRILEEEESELLLQANASSNQCSDVEQYKFIDFVGQLQKQNSDYNLINIFLSLAIYQAREREQSTFENNESLWALMKKCYPRHKPFIAKTPDGKKVEICIQDQILEHRGLSRMTDNPQTIQELSFVKNNCRIIRHIIPKLQDFFGKE